MAKKRTAEGVAEKTPLDRWYGWYVGDEFVSDLLRPHEGKRVRLTVEVIEEPRCAEPKAPPDESLSDWAERLNAKSALDEVLRHKRGGND